VDLRFCDITAYKEGSKGHPQLIMKELGITYKMAVSQSMGDQWWFQGCENVPDELPKFLSRMIIDTGRGYDFQEDE